jgi:hypothetical protein
MDDLQAAPEAPQAPPQPPQAPEEPAEGGEATDDATVEKKDEEAPEGE